MNRLRLHHLDYVNVSAIVQHVVVLRVVPCVQPVKFMKKEISDHVSVEVCSICCARHFIHVWSPDC